MSNYSYNLWKLHELTSSDPRMYLDIIVTNAKHNKIQAIQYTAPVEEDQKMLIWDFCILIS